MNTNGDDRIGPVQIIVCGFTRDEFSARAMDGLQDMRRDDSPVRLISALFIYKDRNGRITQKRVSELSDEEARRYAMAAGALIASGTGAAMAGRVGAAIGARVGAAAAALKVARHDYGVSEEQLEEALAEVPNGSFALILLLEHHWLLAAKDEFERAGGVFYAQGMVTPGALVRMGAEPAIREAIAQAHAA